MKRLIIVLSIITLLPLLARAQQDNALKPNDLLAICGDSITEQKIYSVFIEDYLLMCRPVPSLQATQFGWGGETSWGFFARINPDCLVFHPTVATTFFGMNDGGYGPLDKPRGDHYRDSMRNIVRAFKDAGVRFIVVGTPGCVDSYYFKKTEGKDITDGSVVYNKTLRELGDIAGQVAKEENVAFADVHKAMADAMEKSKAKLGAKYEFAGKDGVHPGPPGHLVTAYAFLKALGCDGNIGTITFDAGAGTATATDGHKIVSADSSSINVESSRYPFCFTPATAQIAEFFPFNQDLNRFTLIVKNAPADKMKITWGSKSKEFSKSDLNTGINLAAEFIENPFSKPFATTEHAIQDQQNWETPAVKSWLHSVPQFKQLLADQNSTFDDLVNATVRHDAQLRTQAANTLQAVQHTIKIEPAQ
jgi:lysophospholipase L1-like esterase